MKKRVLILSGAYMCFDAYMQALPGGTNEARGDGYKYVPGGTGIVAALTFRALGLDGIFCSAVGSDRHGRELTGFLEDAGVDRRFVKRVQKKETGLYMTIHEQSRAGRIIRFPGANEALTAEDIKAAFMVYPDAVYIQNDLPDGLAAYAANVAANKGVPVFWHPCGPAKRSEPPIGVRLEAAVFEASEVGSYCGVEPTEYEKFLPAAMALASRISAKHYIIRIPDRGAFIYDGLHSEMAAEYPSTYLDENYAPAVYGAAFCAAYIKTDGNARKAAKCAAAAYAYSSSNEGGVGSVPSADDLIKFLKKDG
ncbi:MAG: carbohydrate kinase family protein [Clostridia bacterium]|nr:carbohydrate kinase family protein [Clostridia bacterium]